MIKGGRQVATNIAGIRDDCVSRYRFAAREAVRIGATRIADVGAGIGYGSWLMARETDADVCGYEIDTGAVAFGDLHYVHPRMTLHEADIVTTPLPCVDLMVAFEILEHIHEAPAVLARAVKYADVLVGSVPNEAVIPFDPARPRYHVRHYTPAEIRDELEAAGWTVTFLGGQAGNHKADAKVTGSTQGARTLVFIARNNQRC